MNLQSLNIINLLGQYCHVGADLNICIQGIYNLIVAFAVVIAFIMFLLGAFKNLLSVVPDIKAEGKRQMKNSIIGLVVIFSSGVLLYWINPEIFNARLIMYRISFNYPEIEYLTDDDIAAIPSTIPQNLIANYSIRIKGTRDEIVSWKEIFPRGLSNIIPANNDNGTEYVNRNLRGVLEKFNEELKNRGVRVWLTDGYSVGDHQSADHTQLGTAIDVVPFNPKNEKEWVKVYEAALATPFHIIICEKRPPIRLPSGELIECLNFRYSTAPHFHLTAYYIKK